MTKKNIYDFGDIDPIEADEASTRERRLKQYSLKALELAARVEQIYVMFPAFASCLAACDRAFQLSRTLNTPQGILITGEPGTSKTTLAKYFSQSLPQSELFAKGLGALMIRMRSTPSPLQFISTLLQTLRYPIVSVRRNNMHTMRDLAFESLRQRGTRLLFIDQAHNLSHRAGHRSTLIETNMSDLLTELMDQTGVSLCLLADSRFEGLESIDRALADRVTIRETMSHFSNDELWQAFLTAFGRQSKALDMSCLMRREIQDQTHLATSGNRRKFRRLIVEASLLCADEDKLSIDAGHLKRAFERVSGTGTGAPNPYGE